MRDFGEHGVAEFESGFCEWARREDGKVLEIAWFGYQLYDDKAGFDGGGRCEAASHVMTKRREARLGVGLAAQPVAALTSYGRPMKSTAFLQRQNTYFAGSYEQFAAFCGRSVYFYRECPA